VDLVIFAGPAKKDQSENNLKFQPPDWPRKNTNKKAIKATLENLTNPGKKLLGTTYLAVFFI
jgi:hypothetical protein